MRSVVPVRDDHISIEHRAELVKAFITAGEKTLLAAEDRFRSAGCHLIEAKAQIERGEGGPFQTFSAFCYLGCSLSKCRAYEFISLAHGETTLERSGTATATSVREDDGAAMVELPGKPGCFISEHALESLKHPGTRKVERPKAWYNCSRKGYNKYGLQTSKRLRTPRRAHNDVKPWEPNPYPRKHLDDVGPPVWTGGPLRSAAPLPTEYDFGGEDDEKRKLGWPLQRFLRLASTRRSIPNADELLEAAEMYEGLSLAGSITPLRGSYLTGEDMIVRDPATGLLLRTEESAGIALDQNIVFVKFEYNGTSEEVRQWFDRNEHKFTTSKGDKFKYGGEFEYKGARHTRKTARTAREKPFFIPWFGPVKQLNVETKVAERILLPGTPGTITPMRFIGHHAPKKMQQPRWKGEDELVAVIEGRDLLAKINRALGNYQKAVENAAVHGWTMREIGCRPRPEDMGYAIAQGKLKATEYVFSGLQIVARILRKGV